MDSGIRTIKQHKFIGLLAQLVRALACHAKGHGFKSRTDRHLNAPVAQLVEHLIEDQGVGGSNPSGSTIILFADKQQNKYIYIMRMWRNW